MLLITLDAVALLVVFDTVGFFFETSPINQDKAVFAFCAVAIVVIALAVGDLREAFIVD